MSQSTHPASATSPMKVALASLIGTTVEYYDFFIYGTAAALVFPKLFFPNTSPLIGALLSFATLGVGFLARPVGGVVFGHFGDRVGRKKMLIISLVTMGVATTLMGLLPGYAPFGVAPPPPPWAAGRAPPRSGWPRRSCPPCCGSCRASRSAASGAAPR